MFFFGVSLFQVLQDMVPPKKHLLRHQPANAQIGLMEGNTFCTTLQPRLFTMDLNVMEHKVFYTEVWKSLTLIINVLFLNVSFSFLYYAIYIELFFSIYKLYLSDILWHNVMWCKGISGLDFAYFHKIYKRRNVCASGLNILQTVDSIKHKCLISLLLADYWPLTFPPPPSSCWTCVRQRMLLWWSCPVIRAFPRWFPSALLLSVSRTCST